MLSSFYPDSLALGVDAATARKTFFSHQVTSSMTNSRARAGRQSIGVASLKRASSWYKEVKYSAVIDWFKVPGFADPRPNLGRKWH